MFTDSSRPHTAMVAEDPLIDKHLTMTSNSKTLIKLETGISNLKLQSHIRAKGVDDSTSLVYHSTDFAVLPITEDNKVRLQVILFMIIYKTFFIVFIFMLIH